MITLEISESDVLGFLKSLLHAGDEAPPDCCLGASRFERVERSALFWLLSHFLNALSHFDFYKTTEKTRIDPYLQRWRFVELLKWTGPSRGSYRTLFRAILSQNCAWLPS